MLPEQAVVALTLAVEDEGTLSGGGWGLLVVGLLLVAGALLARSMLHHLRKVPPSFDPPADEHEAPRTPPSP